MMNVAWNDGDDHGPSDVAEPLPASDGPISGLWFYSDDAAPHCVFDEGTQDRLFNTILSEATGDQQDNLAVWYNRATWNGKNVTLAVGLFIAHVGGVSYRAHGKLQRGDTPIVISEPHSSIDELWSTYSLAVTVNVLVGVWYYLRDTISEASIAYIATYAASNYGYFSTRSEYDISDLYKIRFIDIGTVHRQAAYWKAVEMLCSVDVDIFPLMNRQPWLNHVTTGTNAGIYGAICVMSNYCLGKGTSWIVFSARNGTWEKVTTSIGMILARTGYNRRSVIAKMLLPMRERAILTEALTKIGSAITNKDETSIRRSLAIEEEANLFASKRVFVHTNGAIVWSQSSRTKCVEDLSVRPVYPSDFVFTKGVVSIPNALFTQDGGLMPPVIQSCMQEAYDKYRQQNFATDDHYKLFIRFMCSVYTTTIHKKMMIMIGHRGDEGKSDLMMTVELMFCGRVDEGFASFLYQAKTQGDPNAHTAHLGTFHRGTPLVLFSDLKMDQPIDLSRVKRATGGDQDKYRACRGEHTIRFKYVSRIVAICNGMRMLGKWASRADFARILWFHARQSFQTETRCKPTWEEQLAERCFPTRTIPYHERVWLATCMLNDVIKEWPAYQRDGLRVSTYNRATLVSVKSKRYKELVAIDESKPEPDKSTEDEMSFMYCRKPLVSENELKRPRYEIKSTRTLSYGAAHWSAMVRYMRGHWLYTVFRGIILTRARGLRGYSQTAPMPDEVVLRITTSIIEKYESILPIGEQFESLQNVLEQFEILCEHFNVACRVVERPTRALVIGYSRKLSFLT